MRSLMVRSVLGDLALPTTLPTRTPILSAP
jgi:hypothetical protein